jgi:hypothetical protein
MPPLKRLPALTLAVVVVTVVSSAVAVSSPNPRRSDVVTDATD